MKIVIVDNGTSYLPQLQKLVDNNAEIISYSRIAEKTQSYFEDFDAVVLSGGHYFSVVGNESKLEAELSLIQNLAKPIFGICYGFELIASAFNEKLVQMESNEKGILTIEVTQQDDIF